MKFKIKIKKQPHLNIMEYTGLKRSLKVKIIGFELSIIASCFCTYIRVSYIVLNLYGVFFFFLYLLNSAMYALLRWIKMKNTAVTVLKETKINVTYYSLFNMHN